MYEWLIWIVCEWYVLFVNDKSLYELETFGILYEILCIGTLSMKNL